MNKLRKALERIAAHQFRADRRHRGMVDVMEVETLQRIAEVALNKHECPGVGCRICAEIEYQQLEQDHTRAIGERQDDPEIQREGKWKSGT